MMLVSIIIPTYNRPDVRARTLLSLSRQTMSRESFEVILIDNGSATPARLPAELEQACACSLIRIESNQERCFARNLGADRARASLLIFLDDDLEVNAEFIEAHYRAHLEWPGSLIAGATILPPDRQSDPFVRYRQRLEANGMPVQRGLTSSLSVVAAGNMSIGRDRYRELGGFLPELAGIEDVDFTQRHVEAGGTIGYLPEALAVHWDHALDIRSYYRRTLYCAQSAVRFARRHPALASSAERERINGPMDGQDSPGQIVKKAVKSVLSRRPFLDALFLWTNALERCTGGGRILDWHYSVLIGLAWLRGYRLGLASAPREEAQSTSENRPGAIKA